MKTYKSTIIKLCLFLFAFSGITSCNYLDVVPAEQASIKDFTKDFASTQKFIYGCYNGITQTNPFKSNDIEANSDEWVLPPLWNSRAQQLSYNLDQGTINGNYLGIYYRFIGDCLLFLRELPNAKNLPDSSRIDFAAQAKFLLAYYHMRMLDVYGPCPITDTYIPMDAPSSSYNGRFHYDYVVKWICDKFDEAAKDLPATRSNEQWGLATSTIAKALKGRMLLYAASPLWNGSFPYPTWRNKNFETPGFGKELVSHTYSQQKWKDALKACQDALDYATSQGKAELYKDEDMYEKEGVPLPFVPGVDANTPEGKEFLKKVMLFRYLVTTRTYEGNKEIIWGLADQGDMVNSSIPHGVMQLSNGNWYSGNSGVSPLLNTSIEYFYTKNGKRPADDPTFTAQDYWFKTAGIPGRSDIINLNVDREPRFYAWFGFDGGDYTSKLANGSPLRIALRNSEAQGYNTKFNTNNNVTGYFSQKFIMPKLTYTKSGSWNIEDKPRPLVRLAELYLNVAECYAALGDTQNALKNLNVIRERAGIPDLTTADITGEKSLMDWVRNERFIELWGEGHRYFDVRRWMIAPETMAQGKRTGLNAYGVVNPTFEQFNTPVQINQRFAWSNRMYLILLYFNEVYKNPQMVQAPGY